MQQKLHLLLFLFLCFISHIISQGGSHPPCLLKTLYGVMCSPLPAFYYLPPLSFLSWNMTFYKWRTNVYPQCCLFIWRMNFIFRNFTRLSLSYVISILVFPSLYKMMVHHIPNCFISVLLSDISFPTQTLASLRGGGNTQENLQQADNGSTVGGAHIW